MTIKDSIQWAVSKLIGLGSARLDAELLLAHVLKKDRVYLVTHNDSLSFFDRRHYYKLVKRRANREPLAYILGVKEFYGLDFKVNKQVLIPRPDTETLVESVISYINPGDTLLDVGTGSACIPISILKHVENVNAVATDISLRALMVAFQNVARHGLRGRIKLIHSNLLKRIPLELFDVENLILTANLPYVPLRYQVNEEAAYEPGLALYSGMDGLDLYKELLLQLGNLKPKALFLECYEFQVAMLAEHMKDYKLKHCNNMLGEARMLMLEKVA